MRAVVTGASGFIGGRLAKHLAMDLGWSVVACTRGGPAAARVPRFPGIDVAEGDAATHLAGADALIHLAGPNERAAAADPAGAVQACAEGTCRLLAAAEAAGVGRFVYLSTAKVYGAAVGTVSEATPARPETAYAAARLAAEEHVLAANRDERMAGIVLRLANGFGAPAHPDVDCWTVIVNDLARQALESGRIGLQGSGAATRSFVPMTEVCRAIALVASAEVDVLDDGLFNLGIGAEETILEMARRVAGRASRMSGVPVPVAHGAADGMPVPAFRYDAGKLARAGFHPETGLDAEIDSLLAACAEWFTGTAA